MRVTAKIRYNHTPVPATIERTGETTAEIIFDHPQRAITCGQAVVAYDNNFNDATKSS